MNGRSRPRYDDGRSPRRDESASSDVTRPRVMLVAAIACALGAILFTVAARVVGKSASPGSMTLSRPHARAGLACDACHAKEDAKASCTSCHDGASHASTRAGHAAMRREGNLGCTDCHSAHHGDQTITIESSGAWIRSGGGAEIRGDLPHGAPSANVPLVSLDVCARCHDLASRTDPIAACVGKNGASTCMDEHRRADASSHRFAAWSAANEIARTTPWVTEKREEPAPWGILSASLATTLGALAFTRRKRRADPKQTTPIAPPALKKLPVIDAGTCLGCHACVDACPFEVLEVRKFVAIVARPDDCCGAVSCEQACPNGSLRVADAGTENPRVVDEHLEALAVPGIFLAGDLTGLPLIKNALRQGAAAIDRIADSKTDRKKQDVDVVIVGAGPAGLAASLRAKERGLRYVTLEQSTVAASIHAFPRHKLVYDQPLDVPVEGDLWMRECTKEELVAQWTRIARKHALAIREHHRVTEIRKDTGAEDASFVVTAKSADTNMDVVLRASHVVVATGRRGSPRKLPIEIAPRAESKIFYHLADARSLAGQRVIVVGLGDVAMEAAIALASQPGTRVTVVHRGEGFTRGKSRNVSEMKSLAERKKIDLRFSTELAHVDDVATLQTQNMKTKIAYDAIFVLVGGEPGWDLLERAGVSPRR